MAGEAFLIQNAKTVLSGNRLEETEILVMDGVIVHVGPPGSAPKTPGLEHVEAHGRLVLPGLVDGHVHLRDSGILNASQKAKEDFSTGTRAAVAGGVTTVLDMPNTVPSTTDFSAIQAKRDHAAKTSYCDFGLFAGATPDNVDHIHEIVAAGAVGVKMYMGASTGSLLVDQPVLEESFFEASARHRFVLALHAESQSCLSRHAAFFDAKPSPRHSQVRPAECAQEAVTAAIDFTRKHGGKTHFCHASTAAEATLLKTAKAEGLSMSMEVCTHHLFLCEDDEPFLGNRVKMNPPLRSKKDVHALWNALNDGTVDTVATDHAPHTLEEKRQEYWHAPAGVPGLETMLPLMVTAALEGKTTLETVQRVCCQKPAEIFGLSKKGQLRQGLDADLVFVDLDAEKPVDESSLLTRCGWSPYAGKPLRGWPALTYLRGRLVFNRGQCFGPFGASLR